MKEKIMNIKNILRIIISLFVIFSMIKSCAKALSYADIQYYVQETAIMYHNNANYQYIKTVIDNSSSFFKPKDTTLANYRNMYIYRENSATNYVSMYVYYTCDRVSSSGMYMTGKFIWYRYDGNNWWSQQSGNSIFTLLQYCFSSNTEAYNSLLGMNYTYNEVESIYTTPPTYVGNQGFYRLNELAFNNYLLNNKLNMNNKVFYYYKGDLYSNMSIPIGEIEPNDAYHYEIYLTENSTNTDIAYVWGDYSTGKLIKSTNDKMYVNGSNMIVLTTLYLKYNELYRVTITSYYGDYDNPTIKSIENLFIFLPNKTDISGDQIVTWVSGDSISNDTLQIIGNQNQNQNWLENTYNNLFVMESGDVEDLVEKMKANLEITNIGDMSGEIAILNTLTGEPSDFIIAWNSTQYMGKTIIPSGEINFSQKVREVPALQTTQNWIRIIMGYSISVVLLSEIFFTILKVLGVSVSIYDQHNEEIERLEEMHTPKVYDTEVITPKGVKRYRTRRTRIQ